MSGTQNVVPVDQRRVGLQPVAVYDGADLLNIARDVGRRGNEAAAVLDQVAGVLGREAETLRQRREQRDLNTATSTFLAGMAQVRLAAEREQDPDRIGQVFTEGSRNLIDKIGGGMDARTREQFSMQAGRLVASDALEIGRLQVTRQRDADVAALVTSFDALQRRAADNPGERQAIMAQAVQQIDAAVANGTLTAVEGVRQRQQFGSRMDQAGVMALINRNPAEAARMLSDDRFFPNLDPLARERLFSTATNRAEAAANRAVTAAATAEARAARQGRLLADRAANDLAVRIEAARNGQGEMPTLEDIARYRDWLSPGETRALLNARAGAQSQESRPVVAGLQADIDRLPAPQFLARATDAFMRGDISQDTFRTMVDRNASARRDDQPASPFAQGRTELAARLDPGTAPMSNLIRAPLEDARQNAMRDLNSFIQENPQATREQVQARVDALVRQYRSTSTEAMRLAVGAPHGFHGLAPHEVTSEIIQQSGRQLEQARARNQIGRTEYLREIQRLDDWREILRSSPPPAPRQSQPAGRGSPADARNQQR